MKRTVVFVLFFLLLVVFVSGTAFAGREWSPPSPAAVILCCTQTATSFQVAAIDNTTTVSITPVPGADCAETLVTFKENGLVIRSVQVLNTTPISIYYTLVNAAMEK